MGLLHSKNIPSIPFQMDNNHMSDLFRNFGVNWGTLSPVLYILFGTLFAFFLLKLLKNKFVD